MLIYIYIYENTYSNMTSKWAIVLSNVSSTGQYVAEVFFLKKKNKLNEIYT